MHVRLIVFLLVAVAFAQTACGGGGGPNRAPESSAGQETATPDGAGTLTRDSSEGVTAERERAPGRSLPLAGAPSVVEERCRTAASRARFRVLCPTRFLAGTDPRAEQIFSRTRRSYQFELTFRGLRDVGMRHLLFGGQRGRFFLRALRRGTWIEPRAVGARRELQWLETCGSCPPGGGLQVVRLTRVGERKALVLRVGGSAGGIGGGPHGRHVIVIFNVGGNGYFASLHLGRLGLETRIATAAALGASFGGARMGK